MITGQTLKGSEALKQFNPKELFGRQVVVYCGTPKMGEIVDPENCFIDHQNQSTAIYVEVLNDTKDDFELYEVFNHEYFVLLGEV